MRSIIDERMLNQLRDFFSSVCSIQQITFTTTAANQKLPNGASDIAGMKDIPCRIGPLIEIRPTDDEVRTSEIAERRTSRQVDLMGYFPNIVPYEMQAVIDRVTYPIRGVEHDGSLLKTRLKLEIVLP